MNYEITEEHKKLLAEMDDYYKRQLGSRDIELCFSEVTEKFDRRKFGKFTCRFCLHQFNPFYTKSLKQGIWEYVWRGTEYKEPESKCEVKCPKCNEQLYFEQYVSQ